MQQIFAGERHSWANAESASGDGSDLTQTKIVQELSVILAEFDIGAMSFGLLTVAENTLVMFSTDNGPASNSWPK
jgi:hypothetical protein